MLQTRSYDFGSLHSVVVGRAYQIAKEVDPAVAWQLNSTGGHRRTRLTVHGKHLVTLLAYPSRPEATWTVEGYGEFVFRFDED